jgi:2-polyprenyl-3-methyl-5-hydroxy-6-metoxy-1,4-benzoquinol methylase
LYNFFIRKKEYEPFVISGDYIYQTDPLNNGEYSKFNHKTKECVNWISKSICNEILLTNRKLNTKILVLGVALGDMIIHMSNKRRDFIITGVDITDINFDIVKQYSTKNIILIKEDAQKFINNTNEKYDYIICDIFDGLNMPDFIFTNKFLDKINTMLLPSGIFLLNSYGINKNKIISIFQEIFSNTVIKTNNINILTIANKL